MLAHNICNVFLILLCLAHAQETSSRHQLVDRGSDSVFVGSGEGFELFAAFEEGKRRHRLHFLLRRQIFKFIDVDLDKFAFSFEFFAQFLQIWRDHSAWAAPSGEKVDAHQSVPINFLVKFFGGFNFQNHVVSSLFSKITKNN